MDGPSKWTDGFEKWTEGFAKPTVAPTCETAEGLDVRTAYPNTCFFDGVMCGGLR